MNRPTTPIHRPRFNRLRGFTLTEILIALALVSLLLVGISRIFAMTSSTISTGQALSKALRSHRAVSQVMSQDFLGVGTSLADSDLRSGIIPLINDQDPNNAMPFLTISSFRVAAYRNADAFRSDIVAPLGNPTAITSADFVTRSRQIRGIDRDGNGIESNTPFVNDGELLPLYAYGERNFRVDTLGFFTQGRFISQTGASARASGGVVADSAQSGVTSEASYVWYGHLRVYNGERTRLDYANAYGAPGDWLTRSTPNLPNTNNRYAEQFLLGRMQMLLVEPWDHDAIPGSGSASPAANTDEKIAEDNTIVANKDPSQPVIFAQRGGWWSPTHTYFDNSGRPSPWPTLQPFNMVDPVVVFQTDNASTATGRNRIVYTDDRVAGSAVSTVIYQMQHCRTDIAGVGLRQAHARAKYLADFDERFNTLRTSFDQTWWNSVPSTWADRFWVNPFPAPTNFDPNDPPLNPKSLAQRQQLLSAGCTQFIVEYAGDFITQNNDGTIYDNGSTAGVDGHQPDGVIDFVATPDPSTSGQYIHETRWYGMPRDVDGDGHIYINSNKWNSPDVIPLCDMTTTRRATGSITLAAPAVSFYPFERTVPPVPPSSDYGLLIDEPTNANDGNATSYVCAWSPREYTAQVRKDVRANPADPTSDYNVTVTRPLAPQMIRIVVDFMDETGKVNEPVTQEYIYPIRLK